VLSAKVRKCQDAFSSSILYSTSYVAVRDSEGRLRESAYVVASKDPAVPGKEAYRIFGNEDDTLGYLLSQRIARLLAGDSDVQRQFVAYKKNAFEELVLTVRIDPDSALGRTTQPPELVARACADILADLKKLASAWARI
jgi:DNA-directed RNA polymerase subunit L